MPHVDEGTLNALLDGELDAAEVRAIDEHVAGCRDCAACLDEVRRLVADADRLVGALEATAPGTTGGSTPDGAAPPPAWAAPHPATEPIARPIEPVVLFPIPEPSIATRRRPGSARWLGWAAMLVVTVGGGWLALATNRSERVPTPIAPIEPTTEYTLSPEEATVASETVSLGDTLSAPGVAGQTGSDSAAVSAFADDANDNTVAMRAAPESAAARTPAAAPDPGAAERELAARSQRDAAAELERLRRERAQSRPSPADTAVDERRAAAAMATIDLDRQKAREAQAREERAREAEARAAEARAAEAREAARAPTPPTIADRAGTYLRIGLDEAARQLGAPLHVIEGMRHDHVGLALGRLSPGADTARPVVRVVYLDFSGRMIVLDQQRIRRLSDGSTRPATDDLPTTQLVRGDVWLSVSGEVSPEQLASYARRVR